MYSIEHPVLFYLLIILVLPMVIYSLFTIWRRQALDALGTEKNLKNLLSNYSNKGVNFVFIRVIIALVLMVLAAVNFRKSSTADSVAGKGLDIMIALDVSKSMLAQDESPNRLDKAKLFVKNVLSQLQNDQVGLLIFAGKAYLQAPLTNDYQMVNMMLENAHPSQVPHMGTDVSDPIYWANELFNQEEMKYKVLLLITDGEDHNENAIAMAEAAKEKGIVIMTVGLGSVEGAPLMVDAQNQPLTDLNGQVVISKLNEQLLQDIAAVTEGAYTHLNNVNQSAEFIVQSINKMEKKEMRMNKFNRYDSYFTVFAFLSLILLFWDKISDLFRAMRNRSAIQTNSLSIIFILSGLLLSQSSYSQSNKNIPLADTLKSQKELYKGDMQYIIAHFDSAIVHYQKAIDHHSNNVRAHFNLANAYYHKKEFENARVHYQNTIAISKNNPEMISKSLYNLGNSYLAEQKYDEAIGFYIQALKISPQDQDIKYNLSYALKKKQQNQDNKDNKDDKKDDQNNKDNQDQNQDNNDKNDPKDNQQQDKKDQPKDQDNKNNKSQDKMNKNQMDQTLQSISNNEKNIQKNKSKERGHPVQTEKDW